MSASIYPLHMAEMILEEPIFWDEKGQTTDNISPIEFSASRPTNAAEKNLTTIRLIAGQIHLVVDAAEKELARLQTHYQRGGLIVTVASDPGTLETQIKNVSLNALVRALAVAADWQRFDERKSAWIRVDPPHRYAAVLSESNSYPHLPVLSGLTRQPYLRPDGSLMLVPGYDAATGMFGVFNSMEFDVPNRPTRSDAEAALALLDDLLTEFSFGKPTDRAAALAAMLTAAVRPSLPVAPMFHVRAHMPGSGKSYLCELITALATPQRGTPTSFPSDDEECRKLLLAEFLRSPAVIEFDNLTGDLLPHKSLCTSLTSEFISGRILGVSKTATVGTRTLFLSSGNNVGPIKDMTRRCLTINLSPKCEVPAARTFIRPDLVRDVLRERGRYVSAALTIIRAWIVAGRPRASCKSLASFGDWSDLCRQPLLWLGCSDPAASVFESITEDPDRELLLRLMRAWFRAFGKTNAMVRDAIKRSGPLGRDEDLNEVLQDIAGDRGEINSRRLGWWIKSHCGQIADGMRFVHVPGHGSAERWRVELVEQLAEVSSVLHPMANKSVMDAVGDAYLAASRGE